MTTEKKRFFGVFDDVVRINVFCLLYMTGVIALRQIMTLAEVKQIWHVIFNVTSEIGFVIGFIRVLPHVSVGGRTFIRTFRYKWEPYLALVIYGLFYLGVLKLFVSYPGPLLKVDKHLFSFFGVFGVLGFVYFGFMHWPLFFCRLPRVLTWRRVLGPFSFFLNAFLLLIGVGMLIVGQGEGLGGLTNFFCLFLYITFSITAGLKRPRKKRKREQGNELIENSVPHKGR